MDFPDIALTVPRVLLPAPDVALHEWAVIACDQHTSNASYWEDVAARVGTRASSLQLVFPEVYLEAPDHGERIERIRRHMYGYLERGVLVEQEPGFVLVDRCTPHAASRKGLVVALDLEQYSFEAGADTLIRTTEGTDPGRLPPRVEVRRGAPLEIPHILVLIDDPGATVIEPLFERDLPPLYDTELMLGGGRVRGWHVGGDELLRQVTTSLAQLATPAAMAERYGVDTDHPLLYAMGDGNHSFATASSVWAETKARAGGLGAVADHPSRHALVELVNLHDEGLCFEPIHRVLFDVDADQLLEAMAAFFEAEGSRIETETFDSHEAWQTTRRQRQAQRVHHLPFVAGAQSRRGLVAIHEPRHDLEAVSLEAFLSHYAGSRDLHVDYIHGEDTLQKLGLRPGNVGLLSQVIDKHALFRTVMREGPLPRKSFSLGEAEEKRYYLEGRRLAS